MLPGTNIQIREAFTKYRKYKRSDKYAVVKKVTAEETPHEYRPKRWLMGRQVFMGRGSFSGIHMDWGCAVGIAWKIASPNFVHEFIFLLVTFFLYSLSTSRIVIPFYFREVA